MTVGRVALDVILTASLVALWVTGTATPWLLLGFIAVACRAFLRSDGRSTFVRATVVTIVGGSVMIHLHRNGSIPTADIFEIPLIALLAYLFAAFAIWRGRVERLVVRDRERLAKLVDALPLATIGYDADARIVTWNRAAEALFGLSAAEAYGRKSVIVPPEQQAASDALHQRIMRGETLRGVEVERRAIDGTVLELSAYSAPIDTDAGPRKGFLVLYDDIHERKAAERERDEAQNRYRELVEALPLVTYIDQVDDHATNVYTSPQVEALLGGSHSDWVARPTLFEDLLHPDDLDRVMAHVVEANATREQFESEYRLRHASGTYVWVRDHSSIVENDDGEVFARGFLLDITKQKQLEEQLLHAQKMDALGQFAGGIAHDFNNLLTAISGFAELATDSVHGDATLTRYLSEIRSAATDASSLTARLLSFSRQNVVERIALDVNDVVRAADDLLERLVRDGIEIRLDLTNPLPPVLADVTQLKQVILNLTLNASDAMPSGGIVTVKTSAKDGAVVLAVHDTGVGMSDETRLRAFEPFFTTKPEGEGMGLGLAVVYGVIESVGGSIAIESSLGTGTTVAVTMPAADSPSEIPGPRREVPSDSAERTRILVVEDRAVVRNLAHDILKAAGFDVVTAETGDEALLIAETLSLDLLLTDVVMPKMSGPELALLLRERGPLAVVYMSGYTDDVLDASALAEPLTAFLSKPFTNSELVAKVSELVDER